MDVTPHDEQRRAEALEAWAVLEQRRSSYDSMVWQTPALGLTAQAFLLTLALGAGTRPLGRCLAATLSIVLSLMVIQLMAKHRHGEITEALHLERIGAELQLEDLLGVAPHAPLGDRVRALPKPPPRPRGTSWPAWFWNQSSVQLWISGQWLIAGIAAAVILIVICGRSSWLG